MEERVFLARRATLDDLAALRELWAQEQLDADDLEKRITEFQVAYDAEGKILGSIGMKREGDDGWVHSEAFSDFGVADQLRRVIWERLKTIAKNYAMARIWMRDCGLFWKELGFDEADEKMKGQLPAGFGDKGGNWYVIRLRNDPFADGTEAAKRQELMFREALRAETERTLRQARVVKIIALVMSIVLFAVIVLAGIKLFEYQRRMGLRPGEEQR